MNRNELKFQQTILKRLEHLHAQHVHPPPKGIPDISYAGGWMELKSVLWEGGTVDLHLDPFQIDWIDLHSRSGGKVFVFCEFLGKQKEYMLWGAEKIRELHRNTLEDLRKKCILNFKKEIDWKVVEEVLRGGCGSRNIK